MRKGLHKILVTGGAGFIGSAFVRLLLRDCPHSTKGLSPQKANSKNTKGTVPELVVVDKLTYAGDLKRLEEVKGKYKFYKADICNKKQVEQIFEKEKPDTVLNFAAQTHVDRSIQDASPFIETNVRGTHVLLDVSRTYKIDRLIHLSSDEVYGEIRKGKFSEDSPLQPNSPYAASKAAADLLIRTYIRTYGFPAIIVRPCNNYGPWQYPEKFIPLSILRILQNKKIPVYGRGKNVREWLYVEDCAEGILQILEKGKLGEVYNLGSNQERQNIEAAKTILKIFRKNEGLIGFVKDRPGHDFRYSLNSRKIYRDTGWHAGIGFQMGLEKTAQWCREHRDWLFNHGKNVSRMYDNIYGF